MAEEKVPVSIKCAIEEGQVKNIFLVFSNDNGNNWYEAEMESGSEGYEISIPDVNIGTKIIYAFRAIDNNGIESIEDNGGNYYSQLAKKLKKDKKNEISSISKSQSKEKKNKSDIFNNSSNGVSNSLSQRIDVPRIQTPKIEIPKIETPKIETPKIETPKIETPKIETPKIETPRIIPPKPISPEKEPTKKEIKKEVKQPKIIKPLLPSPRIIKSLKEIPQDQLPPEFKTRTASKFALNEKDSDEKREEKTEIITPAKTPENENLKPENGNLKEKIPRKEQKITIYQDDNPNLAQPIVAYNIFTLESGNVSEFTQPMKSFSQIIRFKPTSAPKSKSESGNKKLAAKVLKTCQKCQSSVSKTWKICGVCGTKI